MFYFGSFYTYMILSVLKTILNIQIKHIMCMHNVRESKNNVLKSRLTVYANRFQTEFESVLTPHIALLRPASSGTSLVGLYGARIYLE